MRGRKLPGVKVAMRFIALCRLVCAVAEDVSLFSNEVAPDVTNEVAVAVSVINGEVPTVVESLPDNRVPVAFVMAVPARSA
jgi:hypothetical protein